MLELKAKASNTMNATGLDSLVSKDVFNLLQAEVSRDAGAESRIHRRVMITDPKRVSTRVGGAESRLGLPFTIAGALGR
jgi:hypothetical protein